MTKLFFLNYFILQLFFIRLTRNTQRVIDDIDIHEVSLLRDGGCGIGGVIRKSHVEQWFSIQYWVIPFTGWNTDFKYLNGKASFLPLSKPKTIK